MLATGVFFRDRGLGPAWSLPDFLPCTHRSAGLPGFDPTVSPARVPVPSTPKPARRRGPSQPLRVVRSWLGPCLAQSENPSVLFPRARFTFFSGFCI